MDEERLVVNQTKKGTFFLVFGAVVMIAVPLVMAFLPADVLLEAFKHVGIVWVIRVLMMLGACFFGVCLIFIVRRAKIKEVLVVDERGITDKSSSIALGFIPWQDVTFFRIMPYMGQEFIVVWVKNEQEYLSKVSWLKRKTIMANIKMGFSVCCITLNGTGVKPEAVLSKMEALFERHGVA